MWSAADMVPEGQLILAGLASAPGSEVPQDVRRGSDRSAGADGLIPISHLGREYFHHDADSNTLKGEKSNLLIKIGMPAIANNKARP